VVEVLGRLFLRTCQMLPCMIWLFNQQQSNRLWEYTVEVYTKPVLRHLKR
jgi:hypothetical protein